MGYAARSNPRSRESGNPQAYRSLAIIWRAAQQFTTKETFLNWVNSRKVTEAQVAALTELWDAQHPVDKAEVQA